MVEKVSFKEKTKLLWLKKFKTRSNFPAFRLRHQPFSGEVNKV